MPATEVYSDYQLQNRWALASGRLGLQWARQGVLVPSREACREHVDVPHFTDDEYAMHLASDKWTMAETRYLMSLAQRYDLRFVIMADRYEYGDGSARRSVEVCCSCRDSYRFGGPEGAVL